MSQLNPLVTTPFFIILLVSWYLVWHPRFNEGLFGGLCLAAAVFGSAIVIAMQVSGRWNYDVTPTILIVLWGVAGYMWRHAYRFRLWCRTGTSDWKEGQGGKR